MGYSMVELLALGAEKNQNKRKAQVPPLKSLPVKTRDFTWSRSELRVETSVG